MKNKNIFQILFLIIGFITVLEFIFVKGMFTWFIVVALTLISGIINIVIEAKNKQWSQAVLYLLTIIALCMGYFTIAF